MHEAQLLAVLDALPIAVMLRAADGSLLHANPATLRFLARLGLDVSHVAASASAMMDHIAVIARTVAARIPPASRSSRPSGPYIYVGPERPPGELRRLNDAALLPEPRGAALRERDRSTVLAGPTAVRTRRRFRRCHVTPRRKTCPQAARGG